MTTWQKILVWIGGIFVGLVVISAIFNIGWFAHTHSAAVEQMRDGRSTVSIKVDAAQGQHVVVGGVTIGDGPTSRSDRPAWKANFQLCQDHYIYDMGQGPAGRCDHLAGGPAAPAAKPTPGPASKSRPAAPARQKPCPPCEDSK